MPNIPIKTINATDFEGNYVAYTFADGHTETDPPNRPKFKEDAQRERKIQVSRDRATAILAADRSRFGIGALPSGGILRENANVVTGSVIIRPYLEQIRKLSDTAATFTAPAGMIESLVTTVPIGGKVVGDNAGASPEYAEDTLPQPIESPNRILPSYPTEV